MRVVFGWYSFKIKAYKPKDLAVDIMGESDVTFEVRQKCFHLFFIPFFGIGKQFILRKGGQLFDLPEEYVALINNHRKPKTPFYTFSFPILILIGTLFFLLNRQLKENESMKNLENNYLKKIEHINSELDHLTTDHYIRI